MWAFAIVAACDRDAPEDTALDPGGSGSVSVTDADGDGWTIAEGDCDDQDPARYPGATDPSGDGFDSDCDGGDATSRSLADEVGVTGPAGPYPYWLRFGYDLDIGDVDADGDEDVLVGSYHATYQGAYAPGVASLRGGSALAETASWTGAGADSAFGRLLGANVAVLSSAAGAQLLFFDAESLWAIPADTPSGTPSAIASAILVEDEPGGYYQGSRLAAFDILGTPDEDVILECGTSVQLTGATCVLEGPLETSGDLSDSTLVLTGGDGLGSGFTGTDLDGDGRNELAIGADGEADEAGEVFVLVGPLPSGAVDTADADQAWAGENAGDWFGHKVSHGDLDGNGTDEIVVAAMGWPFNARRGRVYGLAFDAADIGDASFVLDGDLGFQHLGMGLATGDLDGDGHADLAVGSPTIPLDYSVPGRALVFFGPVVGTLVAADADISYAGEAPGDGAGRSIVVGDMDGNGIDDLVIAASQNDEADIDSGKVYLVPGPLW